jgi:hypothetical protein
MVMKRPFSFAPGACALALTVAILAGAAGASGTVSRAVHWLGTQQQSDGGFEVAGFPGFETPDATLAVAEAAQLRGTPWSATSARRAVVALVRDRKTPLDYLTAYARSGINAGQAAKLIVLDVKAVGLNPAAFSFRRSAPVNLVAIMDAGLQPNGSYGTFNATLYAALADTLVHKAPPATTLAYIRSAQQANGGWNFSGDPTGTDLDPDTTALAVEALVAGGAGSADRSVSTALAMLAAQHDSDGSWHSPFDAGNPNSTALAMLAVTAAGWDPTSSCWRDTEDPALKGTPYTSPDAYIVSQQQPDGHIASPNDTFGVNTFGTSQAVEGLLRSWLPIVRAPHSGCPRTR